MVANLLYIPPLVVASCSLSTYNRNILIVPYSMKRRCTLRQDKRSQARTTSGLASVLNKDPSRFGTPRHRTVEEKEEKRITVVVRQYLEVSPFDYELVPINTTKTAA